MGMTPNPPMTEGEALAVEAVAKAIADVVGHGMSEKCEAQARAAIAALTAHTAASGGEAVAWEYKDADWKEWASITREQFDRYTSMPQSDSWAVRALYTDPPAAVPADALERLVEKWKGHHLDWQAREFVAELAALIPKGADHEQR